MYRDGRVAEATVWDKQVSQSRDLLLDRVDGAETVYTRTSQESNLLASAGSTGIILASAILMAFLFWQIEGVRRQSTQAGEQALREREERFRSLVQNAADIILVLNPDGTVQYESPSLETVLGIKPHTLHGKKVIELLGFGRAASLPTPPERIARQSAATRARRIPRTSRGRLSSISGCDRQ